MNRRRACRLPLFVALLAVAPAVVQAESPAKEEKAEPSPIFAAFEDHELAVYVRTGADLYTSDSRTAGGIGGGIGVRDTWKERFLFQLDASYLHAEAPVGPPSVLSAFPLLDLDADRY